MHVFVFGACGLAFKFVSAAAQGDSILLSKRSASVSSGGDVRWAPT